MLQRLIKGVHKFHATEFGRYRGLFEKLAREGQHPHTLFITCSDSRVLAELITQSKPGDLFVVKNVGNIVPPASATGSTNSTAAAIEFALEGLHVEDIVVCGHSQCGAMDALINGLSGADDMPRLSSWLEVAAPVREVIRTRYDHLEAPADRCTAAAEENVLFALENLHTYPTVERRLKEGKLHLHGWFFNIASAGLYAFNPDSQQFDPLSGADLQEIARRRA